MKALYLSFSLSQPHHTYITYNILTYANLTGNLRRVALYILCSFGLIPKNFDRNRKREIERGIER